MERYKFTISDMGASEVMNVLNHAGYKAYVVGGCVRDALLGRTPHDWDICTNAKPEEIIQLFGEENTIPTGIKHGTVTVKCGSGQYEVTTFRTDGEYSDSRRPDSVTFVDRVEVDLARRDFTINAMAFNEDEGIVDPFGGQNDLQNKIIRCVGSPEERFEEDSLRLLRAIRFAAQLGFEIEPSTAEAIDYLASRVNLTALERVGVEFAKTVDAPFAAQVFRTPIGKRMLMAICPVFMMADGCAQNNKYHCGDVYEHTMMALENSWNCSAFPKSWADTEVRMALLLHDIGKPFVKTTDENGYDHFYQHASVSARFAKHILTRLRYSKKSIDTIVNLVHYHDITFTPSKAAVRRMLNKFGMENTRRLLKIRECDNRAHTELAFPKFEAGAMPFSKLLDEVWEEQSAFSLKHLEINGTTLMTELNLQPGKLVGEILNHLLDAVINDRVINDRTALIEEAKAYYEKGENYD